MDDHDFLLRLRRKYSDVEIVGLLDERLKKVEEELGKEKSEVAYLKFRIKEYEKAITTTETGKKGWAKPFLKERYVKELKEGLTACQKKSREHESSIKTLKKDVEFWRTKYVTLKQQMNE